MPKTRKKPPVNKRKTRAQRITAPAVPARFDAFTSIVMNKSKDMGIRLRAAVNLIRDRDPRAIPFLERLQRDGDDAQQLRATSALSRYRARAEQTMDNTPDSDVSKMHAERLNQYLNGTPERRTRARVWMNIKPSPTWFTPAQVDVLLRTIVSDHDTVAQAWWLRALNGLESPDLMRLIWSRDPNDNTPHPERVNDGG